MTTAVVTNCTLWPLNYNNIRHNLALPFFAYHYHRQSINHKTLDWLTPTSITFLLMFPTIVPKFIISKLTDTFHGQLDTNAEHAPHQHIYLNAEPGLRNMQLILSYPILYNPSHTVPNPLMGHKLTTCCVGRLWRDSPPTHITMGSLLVHNGDIKHFAESNINWPMCNYWPATGSCPRIRPEYPIGTGMRPVVCCSFPMPRPPRYPSLALVLITLLLFPVLLLDLTGVSADRGRCQGPLGHYPEMGCPQDMHFNYYQILLIHIFFN